MQAAELSAAAPEIWVALLACIILILDVVFLKKFPKAMKTITYILCQFTLVVALFLTIQMLGKSDQLAFFNTFVNDPISNALKIVIFIFGIWGFVYARKYLSEHRIGTEYYILCLFSILGMMALVSAKSFLTLYIGIELLTLPLYALIALAKDDIKAPEASMKYFVMGSLASAMLLFGISLLYGVTGSFDITTIAESLGAQQGTLPMAGAISTITPPPAPIKLSAAILCGLVLILSGLAFKMGAVPFHMWIPDIANGRISEQSFDIGLHNGNHIAKADREYRNYY